MKAEGNWDKIKKILLILIAIAIIIILIYCYIRVDIEPPGNVILNAFIRLII